MSLQSLPHNGRVVIVDDQIKEALPLINVLSKNKISLAYYSGDPSELPDSPIKNLRLLFMDLRLSIGIIDEKTVLSTLYSVISRIVSPSNGPYILVLWSKHDSDYYSKLSELFNSDLNAVKPTLLLSLEKANYMTAGEREELSLVANALQLIEARIKQELQNIGVLELFILWENLVHDSAAETVQKFSVFYEQEQWVDNMSIVFKALAKAKLGKTFNKAKSPDIYNAALCTFNGAFSEYLNSNICMCDFSNVNLALANVGDLDDLEIKAKLNSRLLLQSKNCSCVPGSLYSDSNKERIRVYNKFSSLVCDCLSEKAITEDIATNCGIEYNDLFSAAKKLKPVFMQEKKDLIEAIRVDVVSLILDVSPACDLAQEKWTARRLLIGLAFPYYKYKSFLKTADYLLYMPVLELEGCIYQIVFDLRYMTSLPSNEFNNLIKELNLVCAFKHELISDIQNKLAYHIGRLGIISI